MQDEKFLCDFYTTGRFNYTGCGGGPFGFDINYAEEVVYLINKYNTDTFIETGTNTGDTLEFLTKQFPQIKFYSCEINKLLFDFSTLRLKNYDNVRIKLLSSEIFLKTIQQSDLKTPFYFLDAHWTDLEWPLEKELNIIEKGLILIDDFDIGYPGYSFDTYNGVKCDLSFLKRCGIKENIWVNNPYKKYKYPMHNLNFKGGRAYITKNISNEFLNNDYFTRIL